jgi:hypothetical protein
LFLWVHWLILLGFIVFQRLNAKKNLRKDE